MSSITPTKITHPLTGSARKSSLSNQFWIKAVGLLVLVQQSAYWGYRMGQDECAFVSCAPPNQPQSSAQQQRDLLADNASGKVKRGIVLTSQCSGSEWIVSTLNAVPGVTWHLERMIEYSRTYMKDPEWEKVTWETYKKGLERAFTITKDDPHQSEITMPEKDGDENTKTRMIGFKLMYDQIPQQLRVQFASWLEENQIYVIHLRRKCAALQFASQMDKWMHKYRHQNKKDHVYSAKEAEALAKQKDWTITLQDRAGGTNRWLESIRLLEENQQEYANYLHVYAAQAPVFDFAYESVDGPHKTQWFNALYGFLGFHHFRYEQIQQKQQKTIKTGKRTCEDRIAGLGGPTLPLLEETPQSRVECFRMRGLAAGSTSSANQTMISSTSASILQKDLGDSQLMLPSSDGRCRLGPNCRQREYGKFQDELKKRQQQKQQKAA